jgi:hypothetical protein
VDGYFQQASRLNKKKKEKEKRYTDVYMDSYIYVLGVIFVLDQQQQRCLEGLLLLFFSLWVGTKAYLLSSRPATGAAQAHSALCVSTRK